eukprot:scaffold6042_cov247-Ochromonas_danica.AAC.26
MMKDKTVLNDDHFPEILLDGPSLHLLQSLLSDQHHHQHTNKIEDDSSLEDSTSQKQPNERKKKSQPSERRLKRLEHTKRCRLTFNRIPKDDLRRLFPGMFCNVMNQGNGELTHAFLSRYFTPDCEVFTEPMPQYGFTVPHFKGPDQYAHYIKLGHSPLPDYVYSIIGMRIIRRFHEEISIVEVYGNFKATQLFTAPDGEVTKFEISISNKALYYMNYEGAVMKVVGCNVDAVPAFLTEP